MGTRILVGGVPEPDELFGRDELIGNLWRLLDGNNVLLVSPRRFGKTGVMRHVLERPRSGYLPVYLNVEDTSSREMFAAELLSALLERHTLRRVLDGARTVPRRLVSFVTSAVDEIGSDDFKVKLKQTLGKSWESVAKRVIVEMEKAHEAVVFIIDELPGLVENVAKHQGQGAARSLLSWFRSLRVHHKDTLRRLRFIAGGSTSIDMALRKLGLAGGSPTSLVCRSGRSHGSMQSSSCAHWPRATT